MVGKFKVVLNRVVAEEGGQVLILVLVLLLLGSLMIPPLLGFVSTGLKTGLVYEKKTKELYAADAGIQDGIWQIKYNQLSYKFAEQNYQVYNFDTPYSYVVDDPINDLVTTVTLQNVWIPTGEGVEKPEPRDAVTTKEILETNKLMVSGTADVSTYDIYVSFAPNTEVSDNLTVKSLGIWLPYGFTYENNCNLEDYEPLEDYYLETETLPHAGGHAIIWTLNPAAQLSLFPNFSETAGVQTARINFAYSASEMGAKPAAIAWLLTEKSFQEGGSIEDILPVTWDIDTKLFQLTSTAGGTEVEAYATKCELRDMKKAIDGDYKAIGNSLMIDGLPYNNNIRDQLFASSTTTLNSVPNGSPEEDIGDVIAAYLYWSGSYQSNFTTPIWGPDGCSGWTNWYGPNKYWNINSNKFCGKLYTSGTDTRYLEMKAPVNLTGYIPGEVVVEWKQTNGSNDYLEPEDGLTFEISSNNGTTWGEPITAFYDYIHLLDYTAAYFYYVLPKEYLTSQFKMRFHLESMTQSNEYVDIDDIAVARIIATADANAKFWIDGVQVYLDDNGDPQQGFQDIVATKTWVHAFEKPSEYAYASFRDVTKLVRAYAEVVEDKFGIERHTGNAVYKVGDVQANTGEYRSYAGWSLIVIYSSPGTAGHRLYLFDTLSLNSGYTDIDFDHDGVPGGDITGFVVPDQIPGETIAATLTAFVGEGDSIYTGDFLAFNAPESYRDNPAGGLSDTYKLWDGTTPMNKNNVWNSNSIGMSEPGMDIDTFTITWASGMLHAGEIVARVDIYTVQDNWMFIYMILSVRSETTIGGTTFYLIKGVNN